MKITDLLVYAEEVATGKRLVGYVCGCKSCSTPVNEYEVYDKTRPIGLLTHPNEEYGNVRVYTDTMEFVDNTYEKIVKDHLAGFINENIRR